MLGVHMVGSRVGELHGRGPADLQLGGAAQPRSRSSSTPHPTQSEAIGEAHLALAGKPLHVHG